MGFLFSYCRLLKLLAFVIHSWAKASFHDFLILRSGTNVDQWSAHVDALESIDKRAKGFIGNNARVDSKLQSLSFFYGYISGEYAMDSHD